MESIAAMSTKRSKARLPAGLYMMPAECHRHLVALLSQYCLTYSTALQGEDTLSRRRQAFQVCFSPQHFPRLQRVAGQGRAGQGRAVGTPRHFYDIFASSGNDIHMRNIVIECLLLLREGKDTQGVVMSDDLARPWQGSGNLARLCSDDMILKMFLSRAQCLIYNVVWVDSIASV